jgi:hypothetical protein
MRRLGDARLLRRYSYRCLMGRSTRPRREALEALRRLLRDQVNSDNTLPELFEFERATDYRRYADRAAALIVATLLEQALETAISTHFIQLEDADKNRLFIGSGGGDDGLLATFSARIQMGFALGIYGPDMRSDLQTIQIIRNVFAHTRRHLDFTSPEVASACNELIFPKKYRWAGPGGIFQKPPTERAMFIQVAKFFMIYLVSSPMDKPLRYQDAPGWEELAS